MPFQVGNGSLGGTVFFQVGICTPLRTMGCEICPELTSLLELGTE